MEVIRKEQERAERLLKSLHVGLHQIESFSFMERPCRTAADTPVLYGPGILTLHLKDGTERSCYLTPFRHPSSVVRYLVSRPLPFSNSKTLPAIGKPEHLYTYRRPSLYMLWFFALFLVLLTLGFYLAGTGSLWSLLAAGVSFAASLFFICMLMTRFCYLTIDTDALVVHSIGRSMRYPFSRLRKVNFDFAREQNFTHVMELLDADYRYRLFYIGRVSRKKLNEIAGHLQQAGVDATCSLNDNKRYFQDTYVNH